MAFWKHAIMSNIDIEKQLLIQILDIALIETPTQSDGFELDLSPTTGKINNYINAPYNAHMHAWKIKISYQLPRKTKKVISMNKT